MWIETVLEDRKEFLRLQYKPSQNCEFPCGIQYEGALNRGG